jgi:NADH-quinone oxidoreductase subunit C
VTQLANADAAGVVAEQLRAWNPKAVTNVVEYRGATTIVVPHNLLRAAAQECRDNPALKFNLFSDITCVDRFPIEPRYELNYQLVSMGRKARVCLRTSISGPQPIIDSVVPVWQGANWLEREVFDLFGIRFEGHPDLRRILLPEDFEGAPLRRDFPTEGKR